MVDDVTDAEEWIRIQWGQSLRMASIHTLAMSRDLRLRNLGSYSFQILRLRL